MFEESMLEEGMFEDPMFADSLLETAWAQRSRRSWATLTSFGLQAVIISLLLVAPLLRTVGLPAGRTVSMPISVGRLTSEPAPVRRSEDASVASVNPTIVRFVPQGRHEIISMSDDDAAPPLASTERCNGICDAIGTSGPSGPAIPFSIGGDRPVLPPPPPPTIRTFRTSSMLEGSLIRRVQPVYPSLARMGHIQGQVVLSATISKAGAIENLQVVAGHPLLVKAAIDAVSQWRYRPYILNHEPVEVETQIVVNFMLGN